MNHACVMEWFGMCLKCISSFFDMLPGSTNGEFCGCQLWLYSHNVCHIKMLLFSFIRECIERLRNIDLQTLNVNVIKYNVSAWWKHESARLMLTRKIGSANLVRILIDILVSNFITPYVSIHLDVCNMLVS